MSFLRADIQVRGIVQGVGFRPFLHKLVTHYALCGWVRNTSEGAQIELEGEKALIESLLRELMDNPPKLAVIDSVEVTYSDERKGYSTFEILKSHTMAERNTLISPDVGICEDCRRELFDITNRRYRYPFINCTNCGPRFTIIRDVPYDRCNTSMASFPMCGDCESEYHTISDRRYHAQPDCCNVCGPSLHFTDEQGSPIFGDPIALAIKSIKNGEIVAVKGLGGFHLASRCDDPAVVVRLRKRKHRDEKPFAIMCRDVDTARKYCVVSDQEALQLDNFRRPIVLLKKRDSGAFPWLSENGYLGVMLPYTPIHYLLLEKLDALVMTSANLSDLPIVFDNQEALKSLGGIADKFLLHNRDIVTRCDDSLLWVVGGHEYFVRRSRGYVPFPITMPGARGGVLACGAEQKATFSISKGEYVFQSQHIGDLKNLEVYDNYTSQIDHFCRMFDIKPRAIVCDSHPDYLSTTYAQERADKEHLPILHVQHHWAHMASCMADNRLEGECIGIVWDGTGYGSDGTVWGGEFLTGDYDSFERRGTLRGMKLPGGDKVTHELWRTGIALLHESGRKDAVEFSAEQRRTVDTILELGLNCPMSTGMGRLFDGVAAIMGIKCEASYEGQGAVLLEAAAISCEDVYPYIITTDNGRYVYDWRPTVQAICEDVQNGRATGEMAAAFMNTLTTMAVEICKRIRRDTGLTRVVLSGGTFQNQYLLHRITEQLTQKGFSVYHHQRVSTNDEGISFGQMAIAEKGAHFHVSGNSPDAD